MANVSNAPPSPAAKPLTANRKKKLRQKRSKVFKRQRADQGSTPSESSGLLSTLEEDSAAASSAGNWRCDGLRGGAWPPYADGASGASSAHAFDAVHQHMGHRAHRQPQHGGSLSAPVHGGEHSAAGSAGGSSRIAGALPAPGGKRRQLTLALQNDGARSAPAPSSAIESGSNSAAGSAEGSVDGSRTDMTAALLVMQALKSQPLAASAGRKDGARHNPAMHGNYKRYYGYRLGGAPSAEDPRLQALERNWIAGRRCLDVGCNEGLLTLAVAAKFGAAAMLGIDIDASLVERACANLSRMHAEVAEQLVAARSQGHDAAGAIRRLLSSQRALKAVWFQQGDMAGVRTAVEPGSVDTAMCLSMTKWVHINAGDAGLKALFAALHAALRPGGLLVLEPQPWRSYKQALRKQELAGSLHAGMLASLELRPEGFVEYLTQEADFRFIRELKRDTTGRGFDRPMYLLEKLADE